MKYLIFRTDRIGDFLITTSLIHSIKKNDKNALVYIVSSIKNNQFISDYNFVDKIFLLKKNNILVCKMDNRLLRRILNKKSHWNNAEIGAHINFFRKPDKMEPDIHRALCFLHL